MKDDSGAYGVFTEQGSFALSMTAAKVMDVIAGLPDCTGQAADAASAYTQVKTWKTPKSECPDILVRLPRHKWPKSWSNIEDAVVEQNLYGHPLAGFLLERHFEEVLLGLGWEKYRIGNACSFIRKQGLFLSVSVDDFRMAGRTQNMAHRVEEIVETCGSWRTNIVS